MSWDIYGNVLRRGYCEVHPDVHQEYPCDLCYRDEKEFRLRKQQEDRYNKLMEEEYMKQENAFYANSLDGAGI